MPMRGTMTMKGHVPQGRVGDILLTALAPAVWGSTYIVTTELLPGWHPLLVSLLRALPAGLLLLLLVRRLPEGIWWGRIAVLGALNFSVFWVMLFVSAYRLPGGVAATVPGGVAKRITSGMTTSAAIMIMPCTKSVRLTARNPPIRV